MKSRARSNARRRMLLYTIIVFLSASGCGPIEAPGKAAGQEAGISGLSDGGRIRHRGQLANSIDQLQTPSTGKIDSYVFELREDELFHVRLEAVSGDAEVALFLDGAELLVIDEGWAEIEESLAFVAESKGSYRLEVRPLGDLELSYRLYREDLEVTSLESSFLARAQLAAHQSRQASQNAHAVDELERAVALRRRIESGHALASLLEEQASAYAGGGQLVLAIDAYREANVIRLRLEHRQAQAANYNHLGNLLRRAGRSEEARAEYTRALELSRAESYLEGAAAAINNLGLLEQDQGNLETARNHYDKALEELAGRHPLQAADIQENLAVLYMVQGQSPEARRQLEAALEAHREQPLQLARTRMHLGWLDFLDGRIEEAHGLLESAVKLATEKLTPEDTNLELVLHDRMGTVLEALGQHEEARQAYNEALKLARRLDRPSSAAGTLINLCRLEVLHSDEHGKGDGARLCSSAVAEIRRVVGDPNRLASGLYWLARRQRQLGFHERSLASIEESIDQVESLRTQVAGRENRIRFFASRPDYHRFFVDLLMELHERSPRAGHDLRALETSERSRARGLLDLLAKAEGGVMTAENTTLERQRELLDGQIREAETMLEAARRGSPASETSALEGKLDRLLTRVDVIDQRLVESGSTHGERVSSKPIGESELRALLDDGTTLLSLLLGEERSYLWVIRARGIRSFTLPYRRQALERKAAEFHRFLSRPPLGWHREALLAQGTALFEMLFGHGDLWESLGQDRLVYIGDGKLRDLPLSALPTPGSTLENPRFLFERHAVAHLPSASTLRTIREVAARRPAAPLTAAIVADPVYRLPSGPRTSSGFEPWEGEQLAHSFPRGAPDFELARLPFAGLEASLLTRQMDGRQVLLRKGLDANLDLALSSELGRYRIVHFAAHGHLDPRHPELSAILLSEVSKDGRAIEGRLRMRDISRLRWNADLVVASACQTALGGDVEMEGLTGLTGGFMLSGVPRVIVSLWPVNSESTARLMNAFYRALLSDRLAPIEALREARGTLIAEGMAKGAASWSDAYYWAGFVLIGDWRPFEIP